MEAATLISQQMETDQKWKMDEHRKKKKKHEQGYPLILYQREREGERKEKICLYALCNTLNPCVNEVTHEIEITLADCQRTPG